MDIGTEPTKRGPYKKRELDEEQIYKLAQLGCTYKEIADWFGCSPRKLQDNYSHVIEQGASDVKISLKRKQIDLALNGNVTMLIWLGKQLLGQKEPDRVLSVPEETTNMKITYEIIPQAKRDDADSSTGTEV